MKNRKNSIFALSAFVCAALCLAVAAVCALGGLVCGANTTSTANAAPAASTAAPVDDWEQAVFSFDSVRFEATINSDKTLEVTETLVARWSRTGKTSLIRDIQRQSKTTRYVNGKKISGKSYFAKISDISATLDGGECDWHILPPSDEMYLSDFYSIEMKKTDGSTLQPNRPYSFVLKYKYDMGDDRVSAFDDLTYDVFGYAMNRTESFSAKLTFPEGVALNDSDVTARMGKSSWSPADFERLTVNGNIVEVETARLTSGLTVQVILPKGTFTGGITMYWYYWAFAALAVAATIAAVVLFAKNLPKKPVETVEFYPPEGVSVMEFSAIWHKAVKTQDAAALILKWADMGLISITKDGKSNLILRRNTEQDKNYQLPENVGHSDDVAEKVLLSGKKYFDSSAEREYFNTLFSGIGGSDEVFATAVFKRGRSSSQRKLYNATQSLASSVKLNKITVPVSGVRRLIAFLGLVPSAAIMVYSSIIASTFFPLFFLIFLAAGTFAGTMFFSSGPSLANALILIFPVAFYAMPYGAFVAQFGMPLYDYACILYIAPAIYFVCSFILPAFVGKRTEDANKTYGKILGFKRFLLTAELSRIELLFDENPDYFSEILPWCMIMGISDKVQKRFAALKNINMPKVLEDNINVHWVTRCIVYSSMLGAPRSSGSGGGGGGGRGGSSGGGGGGGGSRSR